MNNKVALVIGATGLVGSHLVEQLLNADYKKVITLTRRTSPHHSDKVINHVVDFEHLELYESLFHADVLFSCLGTTKKIAGSISKQRRVDVDFQLLAAQLAAKNGISHYVLVSSSGADPKSNSAYLKMKGELEHRVATLALKRISILQPSLLLGTREKEFRLAETIGSYILPLICRLPRLKKYTPITALQVAKKMIDIAEHSGPAIEYFKLDELFEKSDG